MISTLLIAAAVATAPAPKLDPARDQVPVCLLMIADKAKSVADGGPPVSFIVPTYTDAAKMSEKDAEQFAEGCRLFEKGYLIANKLDPDTYRAPTADAEDEEGLAPDHSNDLVRFRK